MFGALTYGCRFSAEYYSWRTSFYYSSPDLSLYRTAAEISRRFVSISDTDTVKVLDNSHTLQIKVGAHCYVVSVAEWEVI